MTDFPCPCCGYLVFSERPGSYDICQVCGWEDDLSQLRFVMLGGANRPLVDCQTEFAATGGSSKHDLRRDPEWRPIESRRGPD